MRKFFLTALLISLSLVIQAAPVTKEKAQQYAESYFTSKAQRQLTTKSIEHINKGKSGYYVINFYPQGWAIIAGDDTASPIIGYSMSGQLSSTVMPDNMRAVMDDFASEVDYVAQRSLKQNPRWEQLEISRRANGESVAPLIAVHWDQPAPFNKYCPMGKALVGCVAVAMSQAMSVFQYPDRPVGSSSYRSAAYGSLSINFDEQKAYNWTEIMKGSNNYDETARLLMHAGMAVQMDYGEDGSGVPISQLGRIAMALKTNFKYSSDVRQYKRDTYDGDWAQMLKNELNAGRPIIYNGLDSKQSSGHSWNVDGYDVEGLFHCNWGWSGRGDGYFSLNGLGYGSSYFDSSHTVIVGIDAGTRSLRSVTLSGNTVEENLPAGSVVGQILVNGEEVAAGMSIQVHGTYNKSTGLFNSVPFTYEDGMLKTTEVLNANKSYTVEITVKDPESELTQGFVIKVTEKLDIASASSLQYDRATGLFTLNTKNNISYSLKDSNGNIIKSGQLSPLPILTFSRDELREGSNTLTLQSSSESLSLTIKK